MVCSACDADGLDVAWSEAAAAALCERCYLGSPSARYRRPVGRVVKLRDPRPVQREEWMAWRFWVIDKMTRDGGWHYMSASTCVGRCPVCWDALSVRFVGHTTDADVTCAAGCDARQIMRQLGKAWQ